VVRLGLRLRLRLRLKLYRRLGLIHDIRYGATVLLRCLNGRRLGQSCLSGRRQVNTNTRSLRLDVGGIVSHIITVATAKVTQQGITSIIRVAS
jgi:hypothetical protein